MLVQELMTPAPRACGPDNNLCEAVQMMWEGNFGVLPVINDAGEVIGIVTDRDVAIALGTRNVMPGYIRVSDVMSAPVRTCRGDEEVEAALKTMRYYRLRRLPVVDGDRRLCGILSVDDAVLAGDGLVQPTDVLATFRALCGREQPPDTAEAAPSKRARTRRRPATPKAADR